MTWAPVPDIAPLIRATELERAATCLHSRKSQRHSRPAPSCRLVCAAAGV